MSIPQFSIILKGVFPAVDTAKAKADFAALFVLSPEKVESLFASENAILKTNITQEMAEKYVARLAAIGVHVVAEPIASSQPVNNNPAESEASVNQSANQENDPDIAQPPLAVTQEFPKVSIGNETSRLEHQKEHHKFTFTGNGKEYFKIWIVNILLSIVTLGIYSAWAKVRNKQYFYGNTHIADHSFEYTAEPVKILKGRVIAFVIYLAVVFSHHISPLASLIATLVFLAFLPLIIVNSLKFNARHSSYRNIPFRFTGTVWGALKVFLLLPLAGIFTLGLLLPLAWKRQTQYITNNHFYGSEPFSFDAPIKEYFFMLLTLIGISVVFFIAFAGMIAAGAATTIFGGATGKSLFVIIPMALAYIAFYIAIGAYLIVAMANIHWNNTTLKTHKFAANWTTPSYFALLATNTLGILLTLGLFIPFAKVRTAIYKADHMSLNAEGNLDNFIAQELEQSNSLAEGVHDIFDIDISI